MGNNWNGEGKPSVGQMVCIFINSNHIYKVKLPFDVDNNTCLEAQNGILLLVELSNLRPIETPKETAKQKAIDEMISEHLEYKKLPPDTIYELIEFAKSLYDSSYTKSKVKPLSAGQFDQIMISAQYPYENLIDNNYCIGSEE